MKLFYYSLLTAIALLASACSNNTSNASAQTSENPKYARIEKLNWFLGTWSGTSPDGTFGEGWEQLNDSVYRGKGFFVVGKDTVSSESLRLVQEGTKIYYEPTVKNQNAGQAVRFEMSSLSGNAVVFENAVHDFPQKISYRLVNTDSLVAEISGQVEGKYRSEVFPMLRVK